MSGVYVRCVCHVCMSCVCVHVMCVCVCMSCSFACVCLMLGASGQRATRCAAQGEGVAAGEERGSGMCA